MSEISGKHYTVTILYLQVLGWVGIFGDIKVEILSETHNNYLLISC